MYQEVNDIVEGAVKLLVLVAFDMVTLVITTIVLYCHSISIPKVFLHLMKEYGKPFAAQQVLF